jgi:fructokinase
MPQPEPNPVRPLRGAIEAGGTKFVCALGYGPGEMLERVEIPTRDPAGTLPQVIRFFAARRDAGHEIASLGIASFGPLETDPAAARYGEILATPKPGWAGTNLRSALAESLRVPVVIDTDVNAAVLAEHRWGAGQGMIDLLYITVGTGIGVGALLGGSIYKGVQHPEMGHMRLPLNPGEPDGFAGCCPFHGACAEGLASGAALVQRWGCKLTELPADHPGWEMEADYLATFCSNLTFAFQPQRIILGGGVANPGLLERIRHRLLERLGGYHSELKSADRLEAYVVAPGLGKNAGILGAIAIAQRTREVESGVLAGELERQSDA